MDRREFLASTAALAGTGGLVGRGIAADSAGFATPLEMMKAQREKVLFVVCTYAGIDSVRTRPDYLAVVDADPASKTYSKVLSRLSMPEAGDELHHFGWNICSSCHGNPGDRRYLIVPGLASSRINIVDSKDPLALKLHKVIEPAEIARKTDLSAPHTVHCLPPDDRRRKSQLA